MTKILIPSLIFSFLLVSAGVQAAEEKEEATFSRLSVKEVSDGMQKESLHVFDANGRDLYEAGHVPGAIHVKPSSFEKDVLPKEKGADLVFYCKNEMCLASHAAAKRAISFGYKNVAIMPAGIDGWKKAGYPVSTGKKSN